jgi:hypothetical protein
MPFARGRSGNPGGEWKEKPFRRALIMEAALADKGEKTPAPKDSLRYIARQLLKRAGEETAAAREVADRLDGKSAQAIVGGGEGAPPLQIREIRHIIVDHSRPDDQD